MLSDDEASAFHQLVERLDVGDDFEARVIDSMRRGGRRRRAVVWLLIAVVALAASVIVLALPGGPLIAFSCYLVALWAVGRSSTLVSLADLRDRAAGIAATRGVAWWRDSAR